jgi:hypothetical protein
LLARLYSRLFLNTNVSFSAVRVLPIGTLSKNEEGLLEDTVRELWVNIKTRVSFVQ